MTKNEKYNKANELSKTLAKISLLEKRKAELNAELTAYVAETGDDVWEWEGGLRLSYHRAVEPSVTQDWKRFAELAKSKMSATDYEACIAASKKQNNGRKAYFN